LGSAARVGPLLLLPFAVATLYRGAGAPYAGYDPYHQGEFIYAPKALAAGLAPFRDIFFVHGLGYNTLPGAAAGPWLDRFPNADVMMMTLLSTLGVGLTAWFCLRLWGARWWPAALAVAALAAGVDTIKGPRYLPLFMMLLIIVRHMETGRARWMVLAGATAAASVFFSLDVGGIALAAGAIWSALRPVERRLGRLLWSSRELRAFLAGAAAIGGAAALWLWSADLLGEFIDLHLQYARVKQHYDSLPLPTEGLAFLLSPALSVVAGLVLLGLAREDPPLDDAERRLVGAISLLMLLNLAAFLRGLDRSDEGHLVYASILAWPLAGTLLVFRAHRARIGGVWARAVALAAMAAMIPFCHPAIRGRGPALTLNVRDLFVWHARNSGLRVLVPVDRMETSFFDFRRELEAATGPNQGLLDLTNRPALYAWTSLEAPSRFFATFYASSRRWQDETIRAMESKATPWALWADRNADLRRIDGIDVQLRHWALARHVWRNYTPHLSLSDGSLLLRRRDEAPIGPPQAWTIPPPIETLDLGAAPLTWGAWPARSPREPDGELWIVDSHDASSGPLRVPPEIVERLPAAEELQVTVLSVRSGRIHVSARGPNGWPGARFSFEVQSRFVGPYRIPLSSFAAWVGGGPIEEIAIAGEGLESLGPVNLRFLVEPNGL
jgi:hypothetical protein